jgi:serine/threonine protein kinase
MPADRWQQIEAIYHVARAEPPDRRATFLAEACGTDADLLADVERLLRHDADASAFLEAPARPESPSRVSRRAPGTRLGPYTIVRSIGAGGMGEVYRAHDARLGRDVAIKVLPPDVADDPDRLRRFELEARAAASLNHPNILAVHDVGADGGVAYLVTELLEGRTLREELAATSKRPLPSARVRDYAVQIAEGLSAAHARSIIHRDLKPENLFVTAEGRVKILDFGLAKVIAPRGSLDSSPPTATVLGMILGTVGYMAPEQIRGDTVDTRVDVFAFGCVLYEMVTGRRAFARQTTAETLAAILEQEPDWEALPRTVPWTIRHVLERCLQKDLRHRLHHIADARIELERVLPDPPAVPSIDTSRRSAAKWIGAAAAAGVLGVVAGVIGARSFEPAPESIAFVSKTFDDSVVSNARFLPDGRSIVYSASLDGQPDSLYELRDSSVTPRAFGPPGTILMAVSNTGVLAVLTGTRSRVDTWVTPGTLATMTMDAAPRPIASGVSSADWSPDGKELALVRRVDGLAQLEYPIGQVRYKTAGYISDIRVAPDGRRVLFMDHQVETDNRGWVRVVDTTGAVTTLAGEFPAESGVAWSRDGRGVFFSVIDGTEPIFDIRRLQISTSESPVRSAVPSSASMRILDASPNGSLLTVSERVRSDVGVKLGRESRLRELSWLDRSWGPWLSADGSMLLFTHGHSGPNYATALRRTDGSPVVHLGEGSAMGLSPDGRWALAVLMSRTPAQLIAYPTGAGAHVALPAGAIEAYDSGPGAIWLPDSRRFLFRGSEHARPTRTYIQRVDGGDPWPVLPENARAILLSADGRSVVASEPGQPWRLYPLAGGASPSPLPGLTVSDRPSGWTEDGRGLIVATGSMPVRLDRVDIRTGARSLLREVSLPSRVARSMSLRSVTADGDQFAYAAGLAASTLHVVTGVRGVK